MISSQVKALVFDVFGTVVDWRTSIIKQSRAFGEANGVTANWEAFADGWRGRYQPFMSKVRSGELPWTKLDTLHRMALEQLLTHLRQGPPGAYVAQVDVEREAPTREFGSFHVR